MIEVRGHNDSHQFGGHHLGYFLLILSTFMWSFVGFFVKTASFTFDSMTISFARFFIGVLFIVAYAKITKTKITWDLTSRFIWVGVIGKSANYIFENTAIAIGYSYSNVLVPPIQTITLVLITLFIFKQALSRAEWFAVTLCLIGVFLVQWNGASLSELLGNAFIFILLVLSGVGAGFHVFSQKKLTDKMDTGSMNASTFLLASLIVFVPVPFQFEVPETVPLMAIISLIALGFITGFSFHFFAKALQLVPFTAVIILSNSNIFFIILWGKLFFDEPVTVSVWLGALLLLFGVIAMHWPQIKLKYGKM